MMDMEKEIKSVLENVRDDAWWLSNEARVGELFRNERCRTILKKSLASEKSFYAIEVIKRLNIVVEDGFVLDSLAIRSHINQHMYYSLYNLYQKKLISHGCLEKVKKRFLIMKNASLLFADVENKFIMTRLEKDRYNFKRIREETAKVYNYESEVAAHVKRAEVLSTSDITQFSSLCYSEEVLIFFNMDALFSLNSSDPEMWELRKALYRPITFLQHNTFRLKGNVPYSMLEFSYNNNFPIEYHKNIAGYLNDLHTARSTYTNTDFRGFKRYEILRSLDKRTQHMLATVKRIIRGLEGRGMDFYCISQFPLGKLLASMVVFNFEFVRFQRLFSLSSAEMLEFVSKKNYLHPIKKVIVFGMSISSGECSLLSSIIEEYDIYLAERVLFGYLKNRSRLHTEGCTPEQIFYQIKGLTSSVIAHAESLLSKQQRQEEDSSCTSTSQDSGTSHDAEVEAGVSEDGDINCPKKFFEKMDEDVGGNSSSNEINSDYLAGIEE
ncbi:UNVERIFIED_CONTAM: hypothetical protein PYX00_011476 [Menopon gallinae]|uniref:Uncharacterized protein n=1 Tax=Menopon gallinae TaxID=328185 RepID=A0AAW2H7W3_9NEOP